MHRILLPLFFILFPTLLHAHQIAEITMSLDLKGDQVEGVVQADAAYMLEEFRGDEDEEAKDLAWLREQGPDGWAKIEAEAITYWRDCFTLLADGTPIPWTMEIPAFHESSPAFLSEGEPEELPMLDVAVHAQLPPGAQHLDIRWKEPFGVVLVVLTGTGPDAGTKPIMSGEQMTIAERSATEEVLKPKPLSIPDWIKVGFQHILPEGLDHILFVLGLFLLVPKWKPLLGQTLAFTIAHSISLAAATLGWVNLPAQPVEILIAASIAWVGIENLCVKELGKGRLILVGIFGFVHGLSFASALAGILPKDQPEKLPGALLGFNIGVELGQIALLAIAFACFAWLGDRFVWVKRIGSVLVGLAGLTLLIERASGIDLVPFF